MKAPVDAALGEITQQALTWACHVDALIGAIRAFSDCEPESDALGRLAILSQSVGQACETCSDALQGFVHDARLAHAAEIAAVQGQADTEADAGAGGAR